MAYNFQNENRQTKILGECKSVTQKDMFDNAVLAVLIYERKYYVIPQNGDGSRESNVHTSML
jgi:hypothetical protein